MAYKILKSLITNGKKTNEDILTIADVYYAAGRLTDEQYTEIVNIVTKTFGEM
jgi:hypothetical protein